ncbi:sulfotransferase [Spongiactinospora sp. TRM90649]|uniref:sulfotransferase family protein n=1 Tax=Spongiactinospora sp. TRM90649 TaxID=3031114 RepID=UPI0023F93E1D|nr:sulfotransferase [Spongiactinospora sp. TRM90649]MDF5757111.1 sulfotransferase [Spongiactinospora sp. TRM90649]
MPLPDFLVAGAPKAGTTALHTALANHPSLYLSPVKEPKFFLTDGPPPTKGGPGDARTYREHVWRRADYLDLFRDAPPGALRGESTPFYLYDRDAQRRIHAEIPDAKLIVVLRDPVERAHSNWTHLWSAGLEPLDDVVRACAQEPRRIAAGWAPFWHYVSLGRYGEQLRHLYTLFPRERVHVFRYRDLVDQPAETLDRICDFLGVPTGVISTVPRENVTAHPDATLTHRVLSRSLRAGAALLPGRLGGSLAESLEGRLQQRARPRRPLTWEQRSALLPLFAGDIALLQEVTGEDFGDWLLPRERSGGLVGTRPEGQRQARNGRPRRAEPGTAGTGG